MLMLMNAMRMRLDASHNMTPHVTATRTSNSSACFVYTEARARGLKLVTMRSDRASFGAWTILLLLLAVGRIDGFFMLQPSQPALRQSPSRCIRHNRSSALPSTRNNKECSRAEFLSTQTTAASSILGGASLVVVLLGGGGGGTHNNVPPSAWASDGGTTTAVTPTPPSSLEGCGGSNNCVATASIKQLDTYAPPWTFQTISADEVMARLKGVIMNENYEIVEQSNDYLKVNVPRGLVQDQVEFLIRANDGVVTFRSAQLGEANVPDFGANRSRLEFIRKQAGVFGVMGEGRTADSFQGDRGKGPLGELKAFYGLQSGKGFEDVFEE